MRKSINTLVQGRTFDIVIQLTSGSESDVYCCWNIGHTEVNLNVLFIISYYTIITLTMICDQTEVCTEIQQVQL